MERKIKAFVRKNFDILEFLKLLFIFLLGVVLGCLMAYETLKFLHKTPAKTKVLGLRCGVVAKEIEKPILKAEKRVFSEDLILSGEASYYSENGCLGCSPNLTMANGERLDDDNLTVALPVGYLNQYRNRFVRIKNIKSGLSIEAKVTDTGGFDKLGRVADLSLASKNAIGCGSLCQVEIYE